MKRVFDTSLRGRIERCSSGLIFSRLQHAPNACWQDNAVSWLIRVAAACVPIPRQLVPLSSPHASCKQLSPHGLHTARLAITASRASLYTFCILTFCSVYSFIFGFEHSNRRRLRFVWLPFGLRWRWSSVLRSTAAPVMGLRRRKWRREETPWVEQQNRLHLPSNANTCIKKQCVAVKTPTLVLYWNPYDSCICKLHFR